jgi:hypothetical protein
LLTILPILVSVAREANVFVISAGMYRSGSTWQYNIASHLVEHHRRGRRLGFFSPADFIAKCLAQEPVPSDATWQVLKAHERHERFAELLAKGRALAVYSYRDLRDVAYSVMHKLHASFEDAVLKRRILHLAISNDEFWAKQPRTLCQEYDNIAAAPATCIQEIADHLGVKIDRTESEILAAEYSLEANRQRAEALRAALVEQGWDLSDSRNALLNDDDTLLHWNHLRTGQSGSWQELATPVQRAQLARICGRWLVARGYEKDESWGRSLEGLHGEIAALCESYDCLARELQTAQTESAALRAELALLRARLESESTLRQKLGGTQGESGVVHGIRCRNTLGRPKAPGTGTAASSGGKVVQANILSLSIHGRLDRIARRHTSSVLGSDCGMLRHQPCYQRLPVNRTHARRTIAARLTHIDRKNNEKRLRSVGLDQPHPARCSPTPVQRKELSHDMQN